MNVDVLVIGGGLAGLYAALCLAREGVAVQVLDRLPDLADGARGLGFIEPGILEHAHRTQAAIGPEAYGQLITMWENNRQLATVEGLFERTGVVWHALESREPAELLRAASTLAEHGQKVENPPTDGFTGALSLPEWGRIDPVAAVRHLQAACRELGVGFTLGSTAEVQSWEPLLINGITPEILVLTAGWGCHTFDHRLRDGTSAVREAGLAITASLPTCAHRAGQGWTAWRDAGDTVRLTGARWATPHLEVGETDATVIEPRVQARLEAFARERLGVTGEVVERFAWITCQTSDQLPIIGPLPGQSRILVGTGFGPTAPSWSFATGRALADGILTGEADLPDRIRSSRLVRWAR